jgi:small subunit ribosomal protein S1
MEQNSAQIGQEAVPENTNQVVEQIPEERPSGNVDSSSMELLLQQGGPTLDFPKQGEIRTGVVASIGENEILVSVGTKSEGVISGREKDQIPPEILATFEVGKEIPVYVVNPEDPNGNLVLSYMRAKEEQDWLNVEDLLSSSEPYEAEIIGYNKGGLIVPIGTLRGFVPASQVSVMRRPEAGADTPDARWGKMVGEPIKVQVIEVDRARHRLILSERSALQETRETIKDRLLDELQEGDIRTGRVTSLADFGAFVNIDGADGLVHLSEISWERIDHPSEVLKVGQEVKVKIIAIDQERKRIGLSIRQLLPDPWLVKVQNIKEGQLVEGTITHLTKFGAFARLGEDMEGLIHISELSEQRINHPKEVVKEGDVVTLRVIKIDAERRRIGLSLRKVDSPQYADLDWKLELSDEVKESSAAPQETESKEAPPTPEVSEVPEALSAVEVSEIPEAPSAVEVSETPEALSAVEVSEIPEAPSTPEVSEVPEDLSAPQVSEAPEVSNAPEAPETSGAEEDVAPSEST